MNNPLVKISVGYVVFCEWLMGVFLAAVAVPWWIQAVKDNSEDKGIDAIEATMLVCLVGGAGIGLIRRMRAAWFLSQLIGAGFLLFGCSCIWDSSRDTPYARMEGGLIFGSGAILALSSGIGLALLNLPQTRRFFFRAVPSPPASPPA